MAATTATALVSVAVLLLLLWPSVITGFVVRRNHSDQSGVTTTKHNNDHHHQQTLQHFLAAEEFDVFAAWGQEDNRVALLQEFELFQQAFSGSKMFNNGSRVFQGVFNGSTVSHEVQLYFEEASEQVLSFGQSTSSLEDEEEESLVRELFMYLLRAVSGAMESDQCLEMVVCQMGLTKGMLTTYRDRIAVWLVVKLGITDLVAPRRVVDALHTVAVLPEDHECDEFVCGVPVVTTTTTTTTPTPLARRRIIRDLAKIPSFKSVADMINLEL